MLTKLLLTIGVIILVVVALRTRHNAAPGPGPRNKPITVATSSPARITAWTLIGIIVATSLAIAVYQRAVTDQETVTVRVINTNTGQTDEYQAYRNTADERSFQTTDGRQVTLADVERMEITDNP